MNIARRIVAAVTGCVFLAGTLPAPLFAQSKPTPAAEEKAAVDHLKERRLALVIGNGKYAKDPLDNPANDARLVAQTLRELKFEVQAFEDLGIKDLRRVTREFAQRLAREDGVGLFYYAGHGVEINGRNYLLPVDIDVTDEEQIKDDSMDLAESLMDRLERSKKRVNLIILDACRDNPFRRAKRGLGGGLAEMFAPRGTLIAYATEPGRKAEDGPAGKNSLYTVNLSRHMKREGLEVERALKDVAIDVSRLTQRRQIPWKSGQLLGDFYFNPVDPKIEQARRLQDENARIKEETDKLEEVLRIRQAQESESRKRLEQQLREFEEREANLKLQYAKEREAREKVEREMQQYQLALATEQQRRAQQQAERDRLAKEIAERERLARETSEREALAKASAEREKSALESAERERLAEQKRQADLAARAQAEQQRLAQEKTTADKLAREKADQERLAQEKATAERLARERAERERLAAEIAERTRNAKDAEERVALARLKEEQERNARAAAERERIALAAAAREKAAREKAEAERLAAVKAEQEERLAKERREKEALAKAAAEREQLAKVAAEREQLAKTATERELLAKAAAEREQLAKAAAERERLAKAAFERELLARSNAERELLASAALERERDAKAKVQQDQRQARAAAEAERLAQAQAEERRLAQQREDAERAARAQSAAQQQLAELARERDRLLSEAFKREQLALLEANRSDPSRRPVEKVVVAADDTLFVRGVKLPGNIAIRAPGGNVPAQCAAFSGAWGKGRWDDVRTAEVWVEEIAPDCSATVVSASGGVIVSNAQPGFRRATGQIRNGTLSLQWTSSTDQRNVKLALSLDGKKLHGIWDDGRARAKATFQPISTDPALQSGLFANEELVEDPDAVVKRISKANFDQPLPKGLPGIPVLTTRDLQALIEKEPRLVLLDAFRNTQHMTLPNSVWIPGMGESYLGAAELMRIDQALKAVTDRDYERPIVIFHRSVKNGWDGYHAMLRVLGAGHHNLYWYRGGADAWFDAGLPVVKAQQYPLALN